MVVGFKKRLTPQMPHEIGECVPRVIQLIDNHTFEDYNLSHVLKHFLLPLFNLDSSRDLATVLTMSCVCSSFQKYSIVFVRVFLSFQGFTIYNDLKRVYIGKEHAIDVKTGVQTNCLYSLPPSVSHVWICYQSPVLSMDFSGLPSNLTYLRIEGDCTSKMLEKLPKGLKHLVLYNLNAILRLPPYITHLKLGPRFNMWIDNLPHSLTHLVFGDDFNRFVNKLPPNLTHLVFGKRFDQNVDALPQKLTHLSFGRCFNKKVNHLPLSLTHLIFQDNFNQALNRLPSKLSFLWLGRNSRHPIDRLPKLTYLCMGASMLFNIPCLNLPASITHLHFGQGFNLPVEKMLPQHLAVLSFGDKFDLLIVQYPTSITHLGFGYWYKQPILYDLLPNLQAIGLSSSYPWKLEKTIPPRVQRNFNSEFCFIETVAEGFPDFFENLEPTF